MIDPNRFSFAAAGTPSLADLKERLSRDSNIDHQRRSDMASALNQLSRLFGTPLEAIPASTEELRRLMNRSGPAAADIGPRRWSNIRSLVMAALRHGGVAHSYLCPLLPSWRAMFDRLPDRYPRTALSRFMHFCSAQQIQPQEVNQATFDAFLEALIDETLVKHPKVQHQTTSRVWNRMVAEVPGWPTMIVSVPRYRQTYAASWNDCDPDLVAQVEAYLGALAHTDPLAEAAPFPFRPSSLRSVEGHIKRYLGLLAECGEDIAAIRSLSELVEFVRFSKAIRRLHQRLTGAASNRASAELSDQQCQTLGRLAWVIRCLAVKHLECNSATAKKYDDVCRKFSVRSSGLSAKNRTLLVRFDDREIAARFARAVNNLWPARIPDDRRRIGRALALQAQVAIAVEILTFAPMRAENLTNLDFKRHLRWQDKILHIAIPAHEVKNRETLQYTLPQKISEHVRLYCEHFRPVLLKGTNSHLFPGRNGKAKDKSCLSGQITRAMFDSTGLHITPHQFRHITAKLYLDRHPGAYEVVRRVLGHKSTSTTYSHYTGQEVKAAVQCFDETILGVLGSNTTRKSHSSLRRNLLRAGAGPHGFRRKMVAR